MTIWFAKVSIHVFQHSEEQQNELDMKHNLYYNCFSIYGPIRTAHPARLDEIMSPWKDAQFFLGYDEWTKGLWKM